MNNEYAAYMNGRKLFHLRFAVPLNNVTNTTPRQIIYVGSIILKNETQK